MSRVLLVSPNPRPQRKVTTAIASQVASRTGERVETYSINFAPFELGCSRAEYEIEVRVNNPIKGPHRQSLLDFLRLDVRHA